MPRLQDKLALFTADKLGSSMVAGMQSVWMSSACIREINCAYSSGIWSTVTCLPSKASRPRNGVIIRETA